MDWSPTVNVLPPLCTPGSSCRDSSTSINLVPISSPSQERPNPSCCRGVALNREDAGRGIRRSRKSLSDRAPAGHVHTPLPLLPDDHEASRSRRILETGSCGWRSRTIPRATVSAPTRPAHQCRTASGPAPCSSSGPARPSGRHVAPRRPACSRTSKSNAPWPTACRSAARAVAQRLGVARQGPVVARQVPGQGVQREGGGLAFAPAVGQRQGQEGVDGVAQACRGLVQ